MRAYVHVPFCRQKCGYCKFAMTPFVREAEMDRYFAALEKEVESFLDAEGVGKGAASNSAVGPLETLYFGGGTPSAAGADRLARVIGLFRDRIGVADGVEITAEANPEDLSVEFCQGILNTGVTRLSVGVQSLNDDVLRTVGRSGRSAVFKGLEAAFSAGFSNVGCDLIAGLPHEAELGTAIAAQELLERFPLSHASVYLLEEGQYPSEWKSAFRPVESVQRDYLETRKLLLEKSFVHYEISNFAKPGFESKHNLGYWNRKDTRGFGLAAASLWKGERFENVASFSPYYRGEVVEREKLDDEQVRIEERLCGLRTFSFRSEWVVDPIELERFKAYGWLTEADGKIVLTSA